MSRYFFLKLRSVRRRRLLQPIAPTFRPMGRTPNRTILWNITLPEIFSTNLFLLFLTFSFCIVIIFSFILPLPSTTPRTPAKSVVIPSGRVGRSPVQFITKRSIVSSSLLHMAHVSVSENSALRVFVLKTPALASNNGELPSKLSNKRCSLIISRLRDLYLSWFVYLLRVLHRPHT